MCLSDRSVCEQEIIVCPQLSVIVPVYNATKYLRRCTDSILNQTFKDLELILVDDCSEDESYQLCQAIAQSDQRVIAYKRKKNGGIFAARNSGVKLAKGKYITFVDNDDWLDLEMYEKLINAMETDNLDFVSCSFKEIIDGQTVTHSHIEDGYYTEDQIRNDLIYMLVGEQTISCAVWKSIFKKKIISENQLEFMPSRVKDDFYFITEYLLCCRSAAYIPGDYYNYFIRDASTIHILGQDNKEDSFNNPEKLYQIFARHDALNQRFYSALGLEYVTSILRLIKWCEYPEFRRLVNNEHFRKQMYFRNAIYLSFKFRAIYLSVKLHMYRSVFQRIKSK